MTSINDEISAWLEKRDAERIGARLEIKFRLIDKKEADSVLETNDFTDVFSSSHLQKDSPGEGVADAFTENISISGLKLMGDIRLVGGKALNEGDYLFVEIKIPEAPMPVRTLATVIWSDADNSDPVIFYAGLFFVGINRQDVTKVARFLVLQRRAKQA